MKLRVLISICIFIYGCSINEEAQQNTISSPATYLDSISLTIYPGQGVEGIKLNIATEKDIMNFKGLQFAVDSGESIADSKSGACHTFWKCYNNESKGLQFTFTSECFVEPNSNPIKYKLTLSGIKIKNNTLACSANGFCIGSATYNDILKYYGGLKNNNDYKEYLHDRELGISYKFNKNHQLEEIELYEPQLKNSR